MPTTPPSTPPTQLPVRSTADLTRRWATVLEPPRFDTRSCWLTWFDGRGRMLPVVLPVDDVPVRPEPPALAHLLALHETVTGQSTDDLTHLAVALCRPGPATVTDADREWADALDEGLADRVDATWSLHVAAAGTVWPLLEPPPWTWR
ncbi:hypothetical protein [Modestobacter sp. SYSU DS0875]